jgi:hypothetical protein
MKKLIRTLALCALLFALSSPARATDFTFSAVTLNNFGYRPATGTTVELWLFVDRSFIASDGTPVQSGNEQNKISVKRVVCTVNTSLRTIVIPTFTLTTTTDGLDITGARYNAIFYSIKGQTATKIVAYENFSQFRLPATIAPIAACTPSPCGAWSDVRTFNFSKVTTPDFSVYTKPEVDAKIAGVTLVGGVSSVFGRSGVVVAASNDYTFAQLASKPTTLVGYGITDAQPLDPTLTALAGVTVGADKLIYATGADAFTTTTFTAAGRALVDDADASAQRTTLGLGTLATQDGTFSGTSSGTNTGDQTSVTGNAGTATALQTARNINGVAFDGTANITVTAAAGTLSGSTLASGVTASSLTSFGGTPAIVTPSFTTGFTIGGVAAPGTIPRGNGTNFIASAYTMAAPGTSGNVLTSDGTNWLSSAPAGGGLTIGTTAIASGTATRLLYETSGNKVGEISGATSDGTTLTLVAPVLGTPASATLTNATGLPAAGVVGTAAILGANTFTALQTTAIDDSATAVITNLFDIQHSSSGTPAANFGGGVRFGLESTTTANRDAALIGAIWTTATDASRASAIVFQAVTAAGALTEVGRITGTGAFSTTGTITAATSVAGNGVYGGTGRDGVAIDNTHVYIGSAVLVAGSSQFGADVGLSRVAANLFGIGTGAAGSFAGDLAVRNVKLGATTARGTTEGTNTLSLFNGTAPAGTLMNGASFYVASGEMNVIDAAGNVTLLSPHDLATNEWIFLSKNTVTGKVLRIDMERMMRAIDAKLGGGFIKEYVEKVQ